MREGGKERERERGRGPGRKELEVEAAATAVRWCHTVVGSGARGYQRDKRGKEESDPDCHDCSYYTESKP